MGSRVCTFLPNILTQVALLMHAVWGCGLHASQCCLGEVHHSCVASGLFDSPCSSHDHVESHGSETDQYHVGCAADSSDAVGGRERIERTHSHECEHGRHCHVVTCRFIAEKTLSQSQWVCAIAHPSPIYSMPINAGTVCRFTSDLLPSHPSRARLQNWLI